MGARIVRAGVQIRCAGFSGPASRVQASGAGGARLFGSAPIITGRTGGRSWMTATPKPTNANPFRTFSSGGGGGGKGSGGGGGGGGGGGEGGLWGAYLALLRKSPVSTCASQCWLQTL
jgi:hypothetical protein